MMNVPIYFFSNTDRLDYREIVVPEDIELRQCCRDILNEERISKHEFSRFVTFARTVNDRIFLGVMTYAEELPSLSSRYFHVSRCGGTKTQVTIIFILKPDEKLILTKDLISDVTRRVFSMGSWQEIRYNVAPWTFELSIEQERPVAPLEKFTINKKSYVDIDELLYRFNSRVSLSKGPLDELYYLNQDAEKYRIKIKNSIF